MKMGVLGHLYNVIVTELYVMFAIIFTKLNEYEDDC